MATTEAEPRPKLATRGRHGEWLFAAGLQHLVAVAVIVGFALLCLYPAVAARFVLVDDHEILSYAPQARLDPQASAGLDFGAVIGREAQVLGRFRPVYWAVRLGEIGMLGDNPTAWHTLVLLLGVVTTVCVFLGLRQLGVDAVPSLLVSMSVLVAPGVSSAWVRLGPPETTATVFFSFSALSAILAARRESAVWDVVFVLSGVLAMLSKEPFALTAPALAALRVYSNWPQRRALLSGGAVLGSGVLVAGVAYAIGASSGTGSYGGRYLSMASLVQDAVTMAHNLGIVVFASGAWLLLAFLPLVATSTDSWRGYRVWLAISLALVLVLPQVGLYSVQGVMEGRYELPSTIALGALVALAFNRLRVTGRTRTYRLLLATWSVLLVLFGFSTWSYASAFTADSVQLDRMLNEVARTASPNTIVAVVADPGRNYEPALSIVDHIAYRGRPDLQVRLLPAVSTEATNSSAEAALATDLEKTMTPLTVSPDAATCASVGAMIVLPDIDPNTNVPCTGDELRPVDFNTSVLLWGGESVSLRPRLPGFAPEGYRAFLH